MRPESNTLTPFFKPSGVAVIGASGDPAKLGHGVIRNLLHPEYGFPGPVYPINPKADEILGRKCYPGIQDVPDPVDMAVIIIQAAAVPAILEDCGKRGLKAAVIISGGFREIGPEGVERETSILEIARRYGMRLIGPNGIGVIDMHTPLNTTFVSEMTGRGSIDFISQSGALCGGVIDWAQARKLDFSRFLSIGNKVDVDESDLLHYLAEDDLSQVIALYLEDIRDGKAFLDAARHASAHKFVLAIKAGRTSSGQVATASHTGALAGEHAAFQAACKQSGILEIEKISSLLQTSLALVSQPLPRGERIAVLTNAGGPSALSADALDAAGLSMARTSPQTQAALAGFLSPDASLGGPVDMLGGANESHYARALEALLADPTNDGILVIHVPTRVQDPVAVVEAIAACAQANQSGKPILACLFGKASLEKAFEAADEKHVPAYRYPEEAVEALRIMRLRARWLEKKHPVAEMPENINPEQAGKLLAAARQHAQPAMDAAAGRAILEAYGIRTPRDMLARNTDEAVQFAQQVGTPVALKLASPDILHKTEVGGVLLGLADVQAVRAGFESILTRARNAHPKAELRGVQVQQMVTGGQEVIIGMKRDPTFGAMVMFGLGGVYVEALADVSFRLAPMARQDAEEMIDEVRSAKLLTGLRGAPSADRAALVEAILRVGQLAADHPQITELDINPLMVLPAGQGALAVDVRIILEKIETNHH